MITLLLTPALQASPGWTGVYALEMETVTSATVPVVGETLATTTSLMLARIEPGDGGLVQRHHVCDIRIEGVTDLARTVLPPAFLQALPEVTYPVAFVPEGGGWRYEADMGRVAVGYDPARAGDAMPVSAGDAGIIDWDLDGSPGATVRVEVPLFRDADVYVVQRSHATLSGLIADDGTISGRAALVEFDQAVLGASHRLFTRAPDIVPVAERGRFSLRPVPADTTCEGLIPRG